MPVECYPYLHFCDNNPNTPFGCSIDCISETPEGLCDNCLNCPADCTAIPPIRRDCGDVCVSIGYYSLRMESLMSGLGGAEGQEDIKNIGVLFLPAFILPIVIVILVLSFVSILSKSLGGEYEIPGITKFL